MPIQTVRPAFWQRLSKEISGDVFADLFSRGRYASDASIYQCFPAGIACPKNEEDVAIIIEMAREEGLSLVPRGGGTSTAGQALGEGLVVDFSKYFNRVLSIDVENLACAVEPGVALSLLQTALKAERLVFPIEITSAHQATLGGMLANNTCGIRSLRHGAMAANVKSAETFLSDGQRVHFGEISDSRLASVKQGRDRLLELLQFGELNEKQISACWPAPGSDEPEPEAYNLRSLLPSPAAQNLAHLLAGSEGTLALVIGLELQLVRERENRGLGVCRFPSLGTALAAVAKIARLDPAAIEILDRGLLDFLGPRQSDPQAERLLQGQPGAILLVEFDEENPVENTRRLKDLDDCLAEFGPRKFHVTEVLGRNAQAAVWRLRREALTRCMALKSTAQPVSFLEDAAVPLRALPAYAQSLEALFEKYGVRATIHGHAGKGCLHVQPILNLANERDRERMRLLADEMLELIRVHKGSLTAGQGLGLARGEAFGRLRSQRIELLRQVKALLDHHSLLNPGKIIEPPRFDDETLLKASQANTKAQALPSALKPGLSPDIGSAQASRCSGLSLCRSSTARFSCPSYLVTRDERDSPRGRANSVRLALSGQLGEGAFASDAMRDTMRLCVSCKACKVSCPFGIDIPRLKAEALAAARAAGRNDRAQELYARLPHYSEAARRWRALLYLRDLLPGLPRLTERHLGFAADRHWPKWSGRRFKLKRAPKPGPAGLVALFADTFSNAFEPANLRAAASVLEAAGYGVMALRDEIRDRPLCCGRTFYDAGYLEEARREADRFLAALGSFRDKGIPVVGLEPACVLMTRDEYSALGFPAQEKPPILLFEEFLAARMDEAALSLPLKPVEAEIVFHAHCHERVLGLEKAGQKALTLVPGLSVSAAPSSCCGLNGTVGMTPDTFEASLAMAEIALFPSIRRAGRDALIAATGFSCRKQIQDGLGRAARHPATILELALKGDAEIVA